MTFRARRAVGVPVQERRPDEFRTLQEEYQALARTSW